MCRLHGLWGIALMLGLASQVALGQPPRRSAPPLPPLANLNGRTFVLVANGVSDLGDLPGNLDEAYEDTLFCKPVIRDIRWRRSDSPTDDYRDSDAQLVGAARMVCEVQRIHRSYPNSPIVLMGYCAGTYVVLLAAQQLPPCCVDRIILLSPAVSSCYDIRLALRASKTGMDVFYTSDDSVLETYQTEIGSAEGRRTTLAGLTGFNIVRACKDPILCSFRQKDVAGLGALGGHFATTTPYFLQRYILPMFPCAPVACPIPPVPPALPPSLPPGPSGPYNPSPPPPGTQGYPVPPVLPPAGMPTPPPVPQGPYGPGPGPALPPALPRVAPPAGLQPQGPSPAPGLPALPPQIPPPTY